VYSTKNNFFEGSLAHLRAIFCFLLFFNCFVKAGGTSAVQFSNFPFAFIEFCRDSANHSNMLALAAPKFPISIRKSPLSWPHWGMLKSQIFINSPAAGKIL